MVSQMYPSFRQYDKWKIATEYINKKVHFYPDLQIWESISVARKEVNTLSKLQIISNITNKSTNNEFL